MCAAFREGRWYLATCRSSSNRHAAHARGMSEGQSPDTIAQQICACLAFTCSSLVESDTGFSRASKVLLRSVGYNPVHILSVCCHCCALMLAVAGRPSSTWGMTGGLCGGSPGRGHQQLGCVLTTNVTDIEELNLPQAYLISRLSVLSFVVIVGINPDVDCAVRSFSSFPL